MRYTPAATLQYPYLKLHQFVYLHSGGLIGSRNIAGQALLLTTTGRRSGEPHTCALIYLRDGGRWVVVASNAGSARHPAWFLNMAKNPDQVWITTGKRRIKVRPETLEGAERDRAWQEVASLAPGYGRYLEVTDRVIPIVRLRQETKDA